MYSNTRPTANGRMLNNYSKGKTPSFEFVCNDYLLKNNGAIRDNAYCIDPLRLHQLNIYGKYVFRAYGNREDVFYSGNYEMNEMFYKHQYTNFKTRLIQEAAFYENFIKIDLENFYKSINIISLKKKYILNKEIYQFLTYLEDLGFAEYPIIQECVGLSYFATTIVLKKLDNSLNNFFQSIFKDFKMIRYSDDLYVFYNEEVKDLKHYISNIISNNGFMLNEKKYEQKSTEKISDSLFSLGYAFVMEGDEFKIHDLIKQEVECGLEKFFNKLESIETLKQYNELISEAFTVEKYTVHKKFLNELIYTNDYDSIVIPFVEENITQLLRVVKFDPITVTKLFSKTKGPAMVKLLNQLYFNLETSRDIIPTIIALTTYVTTRNPRETTKIKIISKINRYNPEYAYFLKTYVLL